MVKAFLIIGIIAFVTIIAAATFVLINAVSDMVWEHNFRRDMDKLMDEYKTAEVDEEE